MWMQSLSGTTSTIKVILRCRLLFRFRMRCERWKWTLRASVPSCRRQWLLRRSVRTRRRPVRERPAASPMLPAVTPRRWLHSRYATVPGPPHFARSVVILGCSAAMAVAGGCAFFPSTLRGSRNIYLTDTVRYRLLAQCCPLALLFARLHAILYKFLSVPASSRWCNALDGFRHASACIRHASACIY